MGAPNVDPATYDVNAHPGMMAQPILHAGRYDGFRRSAGPGAGAQISDQEHNFAEIETPLAPAPAPQRFGHSHRHDRPSLFRSLGGVRCTVSTSR
jgi:hypothetical protein